MRRSAQVEGAAFSIWIHSEETEMASFDDAMKNAVPGGNLATPIAVALGALILGKMFGGGSKPAPQQPAPTPAQPVPANAPPGSILGGLGDLIGKLTAGGAAPQVNSWIGPGAESADPARTARLGARAVDSGRFGGAHRHEPGGTAEPARGGAAAAHQSFDAEWPHADAGRSREVARQASRSRAQAARLFSAPCGRGLASGRTATD